MPTTNHTPVFLLKGFSLIELMIVLVIIAVLAGVAIPGFQTQIARAQVTSALSEIRNLSTAYEDAALRGLNAFELSDLGMDTSGLSTQTQRCDLVMTLPAASSGDGSLECTLRGHSSIQGFMIRLDRLGAQGRWRCLSDLSDALRPDSCDATGP